MLTTDHPQESEGCREVQECSQWWGGRVSVRERVTTLSVESRMQLLEKAGITLTIPEQQGLAMKADLALSWNKMRELRRYSNVSVHESLYIIIAIGQGG